MEILRHSGYALQKIKTAGSLSSRSLGLKVWWHTPLIWATPSAGDHIRTLEEGRLSLSLFRLLAVWD